MDIRQEVGGLIMGWTKEQQAAIDTRRCDLLVAAAAGSGKTAVLVERIIQMITDPVNPVDIDKLLVVTFTNAAAGEMRERIAGAIGKKIDEDPYNEDLQRQSILLHKASITTIHSFCLQIVRSHFHLLDLDPAFRIADGTETLLMKTEVLEEVLEFYYQNKKEEGFLALVESYGGKTQDTKLMDMILRIYHFVQSNPWPNEWIDTMGAAFDLNPDSDLNDTPWTAILKEQVQIELQGLSDAADQALYICRKAQGPAGYEGAILSDIQMLQDLYTTSKCKIQTLYEAFQKVSFVKLGRCSKDVDEQLQKRVKEIRDQELKKGLEDLRGKVFFKSPEDMKNDIIALYPQLRILGEIVQDFSARFQKAKQEKGIVDFNDLEHYALHVLLDKKSSPEQSIPSGTALELRQKYEEILIDEYQDSNLVQETLLSIISRKETKHPNMFMVGDVKQSIYRFRLAKPELFIEKHKRFSEKAEGSHRKIDLSQNFRSRESILYGVNFLFRQLMTPFVGEIVYDDKAALHPGAQFPPWEQKGIVGGPIELHLIQKEKEENEEEKTEEARTEEAKKQQEETEDLSTVQLEARIVGQRIHSLIRGKEAVWVYDKKLDSYRPIEYRDIVILLRATASWAPIFMEELSKQNIPAYGDVNIGYFQAVEVQTVLCVLQIIDNPRQDIPLLTVLRSPMVGLSGDELVQIRVDLKEGTFYEAIFGYLDMQIEETETTAKLRMFHQNLERWRDMAVSTPIHELIWVIYGETNYYNYVGAMVGGVQRQANLRVLLERAAQYETTSFKGLFHFIGFMNKLQNSEGDLGAAKTLGENENLVKIISIHKSKGLEYPIVFLCGLGKQFNLQDLRQSILLHQDLGFGPSYVDYHHRVIYNTLPKAALTKKIALENLSEELRILYVAVTRAKEKLILVGSVTDVEGQAAKWCRLLSHEEVQLPPYYMMKAKTFLDWIGPTVARHRDGQLIREWAGVEGKAIESVEEDGSSWDVYRWSRELIQQQDQEEQKEEEKQQTVLEQWDDMKVYSQWREEVFAKLSWNYTHQREVGLPIKVTVSEVKRKHQQVLSEDDSIQLYKDAFLRKPEFIQEKKGFSGAQRGTIMHFVMQHLTLEEARDTASIEKQLQRLEERGLLSTEELKIIKVQELVQFAQSPLAERMVRSSTVYREVPFVLALPAQELDFTVGNDGQQEHILLQGIIDCYFEEEDGWVLVDYKTDYCVEDQVEEIKKRYKMQMDMYTKALTQISGKPVKEQILYLFAIGKSVSYA